MYPDQDRVLSAEAQNPYESPLHMGGEPSLAPPDSETEQIRRAHLELETSVRSLGGLYYFFSLPLAGMAYLSINSLVSGIAQQKQATTRVVFLAVLCGVLCPLGLVYGWGLRRLDHRIRLPVLATACMLLIPLFVFARTAGWGTFEGLFATFVAAVIGAWVLQPLMDRRIHVVLSPAYQEIRRRTPHIKRQSSLVMMICALILLSLIGAIAASVMFR